MKYVWDTLAAIGLCALIGFAIFGVLNLGPKALPSAYPLEPKFAHPLPYDAVICQRGAAPDKFKCKPYIRSGK